MNMQQWQGYTFTSSSSKTPEFVKFARDYERAIMHELGTDFTIIQWNVGHFYISGFIKNNNNGNLVYFSCSDVRFFPNNWQEGILIRTAKHDKDYTGGQNNLTGLDRIVGSCIRLTSGN